MRQEFLEYIEGIEAIDGFGKNACASGLAHAPGPAKKICMCQLAAQNGIF